MPRRLDPLDRARGSRDLAAQIVRLQSSTGAKVVIANKYMTASLLSFYLPDQPDTFMPVDSPPFNQLVLWPIYREKHPSDNAIFVSVDRTRRCDPQHAERAQGEPFLPLRLPADRIGGKGQFSAVNSSVISRAVTHSLWQKPFWSFFVATCTKASRTSRWTICQSGFVSSTTPTQPLGPT